MYYEMAFGWLNVWLHDENSEVAVLRAKAIVDQLPFEVVKHSAALLDTKEPLPPEIVSGREKARWWGVGLFIAGCPVGEDEGDFADGGTAGRGTEEATT